MFGITFVRRTQAMYEEELVAKLKPSQIRHFCLAIKSISKELNYALEVLNEIAIAEHKEGKGKDTNGKSNIVKS